MYIDTWMDRADESCHETTTRLSKGNDFLACGDAE